jgi:predicted dehydrogenase
MNSRIRLGFIGGGANSMIGVLHRIAAGMFDRFDLVGGVFGSDIDQSLSFGEKIGVDLTRVYPSLPALIEAERRLPDKERMEAVSVLTPNYLHFSNAKLLLENGFHVLCEKPLTTTFEDAQQLASIQKISNKIFAVTYTYTGYPMVRQMRHMINEGAIGKVQKIDAQYFQGWINPIIHDSEKRNATWRLQPDKSGISCCIGDIGTHAFDMVEYVSGLHVDQVLSDLNFMYEDNSMDVDGSILIRCQDGTRGCIRASQIATGEENSFVVRIYGDQGGLLWEQENPNRLHLLKEGLPAQVLKPGNEYNGKISLDGTKLPPGHPEGIFDAMGNIYRGVARAIRKEPVDPGEFPDIVQGVRGMDFIEKVVASHHEGNVWKKLMQ